MKAKVLKTAAKALFVSALLSGPSVAAAQGIMPTGYFACQTRTGVYPMPNAIPQPGLPCGNGYDHGFTVFVPLPMGGFPGGAPMPGGYPGGAPMPGSYPGGAPMPGGYPGGQMQGPMGGGYIRAPEPFPGMGPRGQVAGILGANREAQLAAECSSAGHPKAVTACIAGRLTTEELEKCRNGIGTANGCFGPNNTLRYHVENAIKDVTRGPGPTNDLVGREGFTCKRLGICL